MKTLDRSDTAAEPPASLPRRRNARTVALATVLAVVVGWFLPSATNALRIDAVLPLLLLVGIASLLRGGRTVLDRLALALFAMIGLISVAGLVFSAWPWGLDPVPVARAGFLTLIAVALLSRRTPSLPLRVNWGDALLVAGGVGPAVFLWSSFWGKDAAGRMAMMIGAEDLARHFTIFDTIRAVGGYLPFHRGEPIITRQVINGVVDYPQASHLTSALMDNFARSSTDLGSGLDAFDHYLAWNLVGYGILAFALVWGVRWVAGPALRGWRLVAAVSVIAGCTGGGYLVSLFDRGYPSEALGLALLAVVFALAARPVQGAREQMLLLGSAVVGVSLTYYFFLPVAAGTALVWAWTYRRSSTRGPWQWGTVALGAVAAVLAAVWPVMSMRSVQPGKALLPDVGIPEVNQTLLTTLCVLVFLGVVTRNGRRNPVWRSVGAQLVVSLLLVTAIGTYQYARTGGTTYYFEKSLHAVLICGFVGMGAVALLLPRDPFAWGARRLSGFFLPAFGSALAAALAYGVLVPTADLGTRTSHRGGSTVPDGNTSRGRAFHADKLSRATEGKSTINAYRMFPNGNDGRVTLVVSAYRMYTPSLYLAGLRRQGREAWKPVGGLNGNKQMRTLEHVAEVSPLPVRFVVSREDLVTGIRDIERRRPELKIELVVLPSAEVPTPPVLPPPPGGRKKK